MFQSRTDIQDQATCGAPRFHPARHDFNPGLMFSREGMALTLASLATSSDVKVLDLERMFFDELASRLDVIAHERGKQIIGCSSVFETYLK